MDNSFCSATGKCIGSAYRKVADTTVKFGSLFAKAGRAVMGVFRGRGAPVEAAEPAEGPVAEKSAEQLSAVFSRAMSQFRSPDPAVRAAALRVFERLGMDEAIARATALLGDPDPEVRATAQAVLTELKPSPGDKPDGDEPVIII